MSLKNALPLSSFENISLYRGFRNRGCEGGSFGLGRSLPNPPSSLLEFVFVSYYLVPNQVFYVSLKAPCPRPIHDNYLAVTTIEETVLLYFVVVVCWWCKGPITAHLVVPIGIVGVKSNYQLSRYHRHGVPKIPPIVPYLPATVEVCKGSPSLV